MSVNTISMAEAKKLINFTIDNNKTLESKGITPIALCLEADAGIGKTSLVQQIAQERGMTFTKLSLHELDEAGDIIGFPQTEYECQVYHLVKNEKGEAKVEVLPKTVWLNAKQIESPKKGYKYNQTGNTRMGYAKPAWVPSYNENGNVFLLDDFGRCTPQLSQAVMELILTQGYVSWKLPKKTSIFLTSNPDNGSYNVTGQDEAQATRYMNYSIVFDIDSWSRWAESAGIDGRCINFVMNYYNELFGADEEGNRICNPRSFVMFANMIGGIKDWDNTESLENIRMIARGCFKDNGRFSDMFTAFLRNKMHLLIQPKEILTGKWDEIRDKLEQSIYDSNGQYRPDIASMLERRLANFILFWLSSDGKTPIATVKDRLLDIITNPELGGKVIFNSSHMYHLIKTVTSEKKAQTGKLLFEPKIARILN